MTAPPDLDGCECGGMRKMTGQCRRAKRGTGGAMPGNVAPLLYFARFAL